MCFDTVMLYDFDFAVRLVHPARMASRIATSEWDRRSPFCRLSSFEVNRKERVGIVSGRVVIVRLQQDAAVHRFERPMQHTGRSAGVGVGGETLSVLAFLVAADDKVARNQVDLFPVFVDERL